MRSIVSLVFALLLAGPVISSVYPVAAAEADDESGYEYTSGYATLVDEHDNPILHTGLIPAVGDMFVSEDNIRYDVYAVEGRTARARSLGPVDIKKMIGAHVDYSKGGLLGAESGLAAASGQGAVDPSHLIGIYHTHSDESFIPTSGKPLEPWNGDIFRVGTALSQALRRINVSAIHSFNRHDPHDALAYSRSRRTAIELMKKRPDALLDIHRDTPPREIYLGEVAGRQIAKVLMVVGRQNPNMPANEQFAFALKDYADEKYPGLVRGIYYGSGDYNQDLSPRAMLFEMGTTTSTLEEAENGAVFMSRVVPAVLYGETPVSKRGAVDELQQRFAGENRAGWTTLLALVALVVLGAVLFLALNERSWRRIVDLLARFPGRRSPERLLETGSRPRDDRSDDETE